MNVPALAALAYGLWLLASGVHRWATDNYNTKALYFGLFVSVLALAGALLLKLHRVWPGRILTLLAVAITAGFWGTMVAKGTYELTVRIGLSLLFSALAAVLVFRPGAEKPTGA
jgi:hypothetical protein